MIYTVNVDIFVDIPSDYEIENLGYSDAEDYAYNIVDNALLKQIDEKPKSILGHDIIKTFE